MWNNIPFVGWLIALVFNASLALPFWLCWTVLGLGERYFYFMPKVFHTISFWEIVGIFFIVSIVNRFIPRFVSSSSSSG